MRRKHLICEGSILYTKEAFFMGNFVRDHEYFRNLYFSHRKGPNKTQYLK